VTLASEVRDVFEQSNIPPDYWDYNIKVLDVALRESGIAPSDVLAVSLAAEPQQLIVVTNGGILVGTGRGVFRFRAEVKYVPYSEIQTLVQDEGGYNERAESLLDVVGSNSAILARFKWTGWDRGGELTVGEAKRERDRVLNVALRMFQEG
jgi:hypothetical protein